MIDQDDEQITQKVREVIARLTSMSVYAEKLDRNTVIQTDLGMDGDDGYQLIEEIRKEFGVDFSSFDQRYFIDEGLISFEVVLYPVRFILWPIMRFMKLGGKVDLTIGDLVDAINAGRWTNPDRKPRYPWERVKR